MNHRCWKYGALLISVAAVCLTGVTTANAAATTKAKPAPLAPALDGSASGGAVIVILKNQHSNLNLKTQGTARRAAARADQAGLVADIKAHGGTDITQLVSVNGIGATISAAEVQRLRANAAVQQVVPDSPVTVQPDTLSPDQAPPADISSALCPTDQSKPLIEPEALTDIHAYSANPADKDEANRIATGKGVIVANDGVNALAGNPNFVRADGTHVIINAPNYTADDSDGEYYGDVSSIAGQGRVVYDFHNELPYSSLPVGCTFVIRGDAPDASLVDTSQIDTPPSGSGAPATETEAQVVAGIDTAVITNHADVINESYGYSNRPGSYATHYAANDAAVAAGVTVVVSAGDSGAQGTASSPATDPLVIEAGATNTLRLNAQAYGYTSWTNDNITPLSSGGASPNNKLPDLVAPGYGGEAACSPTGSDCPTNTLTEAFGGTSEAAPLIAGAAADVIQAFRDSHGGTSPSPAVVKQILTGTATDVDSPADEQGSGLLNIYKAVRAAQQLPGSTLVGTPNDAASLIPSQTQLDVTAAGGSTDTQSVTLYNASNAASTIRGSYRSLRPYTQIGSTVTEPVSAPDPSLPIPAEGAQAATPITFTVPAGLARLQTSMIWPDPTNGAILSYDLIDPNGALTQISYDYGTPTTNPTRSPFGSVPDIGNTEVADPVPGTWTAIVRWANGRSHLQEPPNVPGSYTGNLSFRAMGSTFVTTSALAPVTVPANSSSTVTLNIKMPSAAGDAPESVQFVGSKGATLSLPIARRTLIPTSAAKNKFSTYITGSVGRGIGQISTFNVNVPAGENDMTVLFNTADFNADNAMTFWLVNPSGQVVEDDRTPSTTQQGIGAVPTGNASLIVAAPASGLWEIDVELNLTTSGQEFVQTVNGTLGFDQSQVQVLSGVPTSATTTVSPTAGRAFTLSVKNTAGVGRSFKIKSSNPDLSGGAATTAVYLPANTSALISSEFLPTAAAGTVVSGTLTVTSNSSYPSNPTTGTQTFAVIPYTYTVASS